MKTLSYTHITILVVLCILLVFLCIILAVHTKQENSRTNTDKDAISKFVDKRRRLIRATGSKMSVDLYLGLILACPLIAGIGLYLYTGNILLSVIIAVVAGFVPRLLIEIVANAQRKAFEEKYVRSLEQMASALSAGMTITQAVDDVAKCKYINAQLRNEYTTMSNSLKMGTPVATAFSNFAEAVDSDDARDVAIAIDIQNEIGGQEAEVVKEIAGNIHDRMILRKEVKTIFSGTSSMLHIMNFLAPASMLIFAVTSPSYLQSYFESPGKIAIFIILIIFPFLGIFVTRSMLKKVTSDE